MPRPQMLLQPSGENSTRRPVDVDHPSEPLAHWLVAKRMFVATNQPRSQGLQTDGRRVCENLARVPTTTGGAQERSLSPRTWKWPRHS